MKKLILICIALCFLAAAPALAIESAYDQVGYDESFYIEYLKKLKQEGMYVQSRDGKSQAVVPKAQKEQKVEQQSIENGDDSKVSN